MEKITLCIDIGNTSTKAAIYQKNIQTAYFSDFNDETFYRLQKEHNHLSIIYTASGTNEALECVLEKALNCHKLSWKSKLPLKLDYHTPETLGGDRLAAAVGAADLFPNHTCIVIDFGTCITIDLVSNQTFLGGMISPGIKMRLDAMHCFTKKLPLVTVNKKITYPGKSTEECMQLGAYQSVKWELMGFLGQFSAVNSPIKVIEISPYTSGLEKEINIPIFAAPNLVLHGLNLIQQLNEL